ncbi:hypothetical protein [Sphingomonas morindae]|uniref:Uncharacterized protein n=1 Tax=Sphingomonas morindae TaxID=1541170 RepID=A0ABY4XD36_9SPHN|nr:hypothetical protein [Sphingomonas morindae]USI74666.1 hypothetical protein LHA26_18115 [Sphingomonas morindae]
MKYSKEMYAGCIGLFFLPAATLAATVTPASVAVTVSGTLTKDLDGQFTTKCRVWMIGVTHRHGISFTHRHSVNINGGPLACDADMAIPLRLQADTPKKATLKNVTIDTHRGRCGPGDAVLPWNNATSTLGPGTATLKIDDKFSQGKACHLSGSLTISPAIRIR